MLTDSHTHLYLKEFDHDIDAIITEAINKKITRFLLPNIDNKSLPKLLKTCEKYKNLLFPMIGLHPCQVDEYYIQELNKLHKHINQNKFIGIGEVGIDLYWSKQFIEQQKDAFNIQIEWGSKENLPIIIHSRNSFKETYELLNKNKNKNVSGIFHCFSGTYTEAKKIIDLGFYLGIGGVLTFKNSDLKSVLKKIELKHIVLETDAPYLAPHPMRGKRNEPKFLSIIAEKICEIKNCKMEELSSITSKNIDDIFFKKK